MFLSQLVFFVLSISENVSFIDKLKTFVGI